MNSTTEICEDKERVKLRKQMLVQSKTGTLLGNWVISRVLDVQMTSNFYIDLVRHRPTTFMFSSRSKKAFCKSKLQQQRRSLNLSCSPNTVQCLTHIQSSRSPNDLHFFFQKAESISYNVYVFQWTHFGWQHFCFIQTRR